MSDMQQNKNKTGSDPFDTSAVALEAFNKTVKKKVEEQASSAMDQGVDPKELFSNLMQVYYPNGKPEAEEEDANEVDIFKTLLNISSIPVPTGDKMNPVASLIRKGKFKTTDVEEPLGISNALQFMKLVNSEQKEGREIKKNQLDSIEQILKIIPGLENLGKKQEGKSFEKDRQGDLTDKGIRDKALAEAQVADEITKGKNEGKEVFERDSSGNLTEKGLQDKLMVEQDVKDKIEARKKEILKGDVFETDPATGKLTSEGLKQQELTKLLTKAGFEKQEKFNEAKKAMGDFISGFELAEKELTNILGEDAIDQGLIGATKRMYGEALVSFPLLKRLDKLPSNAAFSRNIKKNANQMARNVEGGRVTDNDREVYAAILANSLTGSSAQNAELLALQLVEMDNKMEDGDRKMSIDPQVARFARSKSPTLRRAAEIVKKIRENNGDLGKVMRDKNGNWARVFKDGTAIELGNVENATAGFNLENRKPSQEVDLEKFRNLSEYNEE